MTHEHTPLPFSADTPWLAPLAGYSDLPFRLLTRELGASCCTTEMISAKGLYYKSPGTKRLLQTIEADRPLIAQLFGAEEDMLRFAVHALQEQGFRFFDLNIGCSVPKVMRQRSGAGMLADCDNLLSCAKAMLEEAGEGNVGFKLRLGIDHNQNIVPDIPRKLEDLGAGWITLHPRHAKQYFKGTADWSQLTLLAKTLSIPVVASGDLLTAEDGIRCLAETGVSTVMYARGALANPAIFQDHKALLAGKQPKRQTPEELKTILLRHLELARLHANGTNPLARMRGILAAYVRNLSNARSVRMALCTCSTWEDFQTVVHEMIA